MAAELEHLHAPETPVGARDTTAPEAERRLVARLRSGELEALEALYDAFRAPIFGFLMRLARDRHVAEDLFQNTWVKVSRSARRLREQTDLRAWIFTIARNEYRSHRRWELFDISQLLVFGARADAGAARSEGPEGSEGYIEREVIERALASLADGDREVLLLIGVEDLTAQQAACVLGVSNAALRQRLARARVRLRERLRQLGEPSETPKARQT